MRSVKTSPHRDRLRVAFLGPEGLTVAAVILLVSFGSVLAMGLPILSAILGVGVATGLIALLVLNTATVANGVSGAATVVHDGPYGGLVGKTVALEPATGFSFDSPMRARPR